MPVIRDREGNIYSMSFKDLEQFKVTEAELAEIDLEPEGDVELQQVSRPQPTPHQWYAGD